MSNCLVITKKLTLCFEGYEIWYSRIKVYLPNIVVYNTTLRWQLRNIVLCKLTADNELLLLTMIHAFSRSSVLSLCSFVKEENEKASIHSWIYINLEVTSP